MGKLEYFTVHDLRRTFRSLAASLGIAGNVAERCLSHKLKGVEGIYDRPELFENSTLKSAELPIKPWLMWLNHWWYSPLGFR